MPYAGIFVPVSVPFAGTVADLRSLCSLLRTLSRTDVLFWCARLNHVLTNAGSMTRHERQLFGIREFFTKEEFVLIQDYVRGRGRGGAEATVFFRGQVLEVLRWALLVCQDDPNDGSTFEDPEVRRTFAKVALIASDIWAKRVYGDAFCLDDGIDVARQRTVGPLRKGVEGSGVSPDELSHGLGRGWLLFHDLMPAIDSSFTETFESATGLTIEDYYVCCSCVITHFLRPGSEATIFDARMIGNTTQAQSPIQRFIGLESQTVDELRDALWGETTSQDVTDEQIRLYDYKALRAKPILRASDGRAIILDPIFMSEKTSVGPLFHVARIVGQNANSLFINFGYAFERYVQDVLRRCFPNPGLGLFDRLTCDVHWAKSGRELLQIDACLNYVTELLLFEIKGTWPREPELTPGNFESLLQSLRRQYGVSEEGKRGAVGQLARAIEAIRGGEWLGPDNEFQAVNRILPILVVHDSLLDAPGFGRFVLAEFDRAFEDDFHEQMQARLRCMRVDPPVIVTVQDIECLETSLEHFGLREVLIEYSETHPDRAVSLRDFLASSPKYSHRIYANRFLASVALDRLNCTVDRLFPLVVA